MPESPKFSPMPIQKEAAKNPKNKAENVQLEMEAVLQEFYKGKNVSLLFEKIKK
jgi:hypothetical protein